MRERAAQVDGEVGIKQRDFVNAVARDQIDESQRRRARRRER